LAQGVLCVRRFNEPACKMYFYWISLINAACNMHGPYCCSFRIVCSMAIRFLIACPCRGISMLLLRLLFLIDLNPIWVICHQWPKGNRTLRQVIQLLWNVCEFSAIDLYWLAKNKKKQPSIWREFRSNGTSFYIFYDTSSRRLPKCQNQFKNS